MKVTIVHKPDCPKGYVAIREFVKDDHDIELYHSLSEIQDVKRRDAMMADVQMCDGDENACPLVFIYDRYIPWQPKGA